MRYYKSLKKVISAFLSLSITLLYCPLSVYASDISGFTQTSGTFNIEANKLITYLGGKDNIINAEANMSRFKVILKDTKLVDKEGIQKLGAQGIVDIDNQLKIIFGKDAKTLKKYISEIV